ncbi:peroxisomal leader peptide-processing protease isoform X2 [Bacillus rossius redtenbacheri]
MRDSVMVQQAQQPQQAQQERARGCLVRCSWGERGEEARSSGLALGRGWALAPATVLGALRPQTRQLLASLPARRPGPLSATRFHVDGRPAAARYAWRCPLLARAATLLQGWALRPDRPGYSDNTDPEEEAARLLLPVFLLLELEEGEEKGEKVEDVLRRVAATLGGAPARGAPLLVEATPFCSPLFLNSLSRGVVSNVLGPQGCLLLTDARTAHGCEGGAIFSAAEGDRRLVGVVACSLAWWRGEWVGFTLGVLLAPVLDQALRGRTPGPVPGRVTAPLGLDDAVVLVRCGSGWGSGVVVDKSKGTIVTCSHVISQVDKSPVSVQWKARRLTARLLHRTRDGAAYDVAVLSVGRVAGLQQLQLAEGAPVVGEEVLAAGFPIFSEDGVLPTVTQGVVARVQGPGPSFLQTTCCVQSGASGGAVLARSDRLLAVVVCNIKDHGTGAVYPHVNLAVPSTVLAAPLAQFAATGDVECLRTLESDDPEVQRSWRLQQLSSRL